jgi:hypothetical protein
LNEQERRYLRILRRDGFVVIDQHLPRAVALALRDELLAYVKDRHDVDFPNGAYLRCWNQRSHDDGVRRIYHVERLVERLVEFRHDPLVMRMAERYYGFPFYSGTLVYQHNLQCNHNTRGYHVDWFGKEFKAFLYLDDVNEGNGPFTYLKGSHRFHFRRLKKQIVARPGTSPTGFDEGELAGVLNREVHVLAPAGTLILADVRGIHRGSPQLSGPRSVLVNYMYPHPGDVRLDA